MTKKDKHLLLNEYIDNHFNSITNFKDYLPCLKSFEEFIKNNKIHLSLLDYLSLLDNFSFKKSIWYLLYSDDNSIGRYLFDINFVKEIKLANQVKHNIITLNKFNFNNYHLNVYLTYNKEISKYPLLNAKEERELIKMAQNGDIFARNFFLKCNLRLVVNIAKKYVNTSYYVDQNDLIQEGNLGLIDALNKFDLSKNTRFSTYAYPRILQKVLFHIYGYSSIIHYPREVARIIQKIRVFENNYLDKYKMLPSLSEISEGTGLDIDKIQDLKKYMYQIVSLSFEFMYNDIEGGNSYLLQRNKNLLTSDDNVEEEIEKKELVTKMDELIDRFITTPVKLDILKHRYGFFNEDLLSLDEIASKYNCSKQNIHIKEVSLLRKLRENPEIKELAIFLDYMEESLRRLQSLKKRKNKINL